MKKTKEVKTEEVFTYDELLEPIVEEASKRLRFILASEPRENKQLYYAGEMSKLYAGFFWNCCCVHQCLMCSSLAWAEVTHRAMSADDESIRPHGETLQ